MRHQTAEAELDQVLRAWFEGVKKETTDLTVLDRQDITRAGAKIFAKHLRDETRAKHYSTHNEEHAADHVVSAVSREKDHKNSYEAGSTDVGWADRYYAMNMMRCNDGTSFFKGDHFITNLQNNMMVVNECLSAEKREYARIVVQKESQEG